MSKPMPRRCDKCADDVLLKSADLVAICRCGHTLLRRPRPTEQGSA